MAPSHKQLGCPAAHYPQPVLHVIVALGLTERCDPSEYRYPLSELSQVRRVELCFELGLAAKHDLEKLRRARLQIREKTDILQDLFGKVLRFVDDEGHDLARNCPFEQIVFESIDKEEGVLVRHGESQLRQDMFSTAPGMLRMC